MIRILLKYEGQQISDGVTYYEIRFQFIHPSMFDPLSPSGWVGKILDIVGANLPDVSILEYLPKSFFSGESLGNWTIPCDLYLLSASVGVANSESFGVSNLLVLSVIAIYTAYAPFTPGVTFIPDYVDSPNLEVFDPPVQLTPGWWFYLPKSSGSLEVPYASHWKSNDNVLFYPSLLFLWGGAVYDTHHFLSHLGEFQLASGWHGVFGWELVRFRVAGEERVDVYCSGYTPPQGCYFENAQSEYRYNCPYNAFVNPSPLLRPMETTLLQDSFLPFLEKDGEGINIPPVSLLRGKNQTVSAFEPFKVQNGDFLINGEPLGVRR